MATTVVKTIGNGTRDYTSIQAWEDAAPANLVSVDQVWEGQLYPEGAGTNGEWTITAAISISGSTTDATRFKRLRCAAGQSFADTANRLTNALRYNAANGVAIRNTNGYGGYTLDINEANAQIDGLQIYGQNAVAAVLAQQANIKASRCLSHNANVQSAIQSLNTFSATNCIAINSGGGPILRATNATASYTGCTLVRPAGTVANAVVTTYGGVIVAKDCAVFGNTNVSGFSGSSSYCATDATTFPGTNNQVSLTTANQFTDVSSLAALDLRPKAGNGLQFGVTDAALGGVDVFGQTRAATPTIGAVEYVTGGGAAALAGNATDVATATGTLAAPGSPALNGNAADQAGATGTLSTGIKLAGNAADVASATGTLAASITLTGDPLCRNNGDLAANAALSYVTLLNPATRAVVQEFTGLSTDAAGVFRCTGGGLAAGTYLVIWMEATGEMGIALGTAQ